MNRSRCHLGCGLMLPRESLLGEKRRFWGVIFGHAQLARSQYSQPCSPGGWASSGYPSALGACCHIVVISFSSSLQAFLSLFLLCMMLQLAILVVTCNNILSFSFICSRFLLRDIQLHVRGTFLSKHTSVQCAYTTTTSV